MTRRTLVDAPEQRSARKRSLPTIRSPGPVFLAFAAQSYREARDLPDDAGAIARFRPLELRLSALTFMASALEAHMVAVHQCFFARDMPTREVLLWRRGPLIARFADLLPRKVYSARRQRLLADVVELIDVARQPPPIAVAEQIDLFERTERPSGPEFWFGNSVWVRRDVPRLPEEERHHPAALPTDPLELEDESMQTALLILLEQCVLLDRHYTAWAEWPLATRIGSETLTAAAWFDEMRQAYNGPHAAYFRRISLLPAD